MVFPEENGIQFMVFIVDDVDGPETRMMTGGEYSRVLEGLCLALGMECVDWGGVRRPQLAMEVNNINVNGRFDIRFVRRRGGRDIVVTVRLRRDNLFVLGYRVEGEPWREFRTEDGRHLADPNSLFLAFDGNYNRLITNGDITGLVVGDRALREALDALIANDGGRLKRALVTIIVMFSEAARFRPVRDFVQYVFYNPGANYNIQLDDRAIPHGMNALVHRWGPLSGRIQYYIQHPHARWVPQTITVLGPPQPVRGQHRVVRREPITITVATVKEMLEHMGILHNNPANVLPF